MIYQELAPPQDLQYVVACFWRFCLEEGDPAPILHTIPPDGTVSISWARREGVLAFVGPRTEALRLTVQASAEYLGVRLRPGASGAVLGIDGGNLRDRMGLLGMVAPARAESLQRALAANRNAGFEQVFGDVIRSWELGGMDPVVATVVERILAGSESPLTDGLGLGYRQVLRRFAAAVGLTPKEYSRLMRIRAACIQALMKDGEGNTFRWAEISADTGFADQAHMSREFGKAFGWPPGLVHEYLRQIEHRGVHPIG